MAAATTLREWFESPDVGTQLSGKKLEHALEVCDENLIESVEDLQVLWARDGDSLASLREAGFKEVVVLSIDAGFTADAAPASSSPPTPAPAPAVLVKKEASPSTSPTASPTGSPNTSPTARERDPDIVVVHNPVAENATLSDDGVQKGYDYFINHCQGTGQDQARMLRELLVKAGANVWYDMESDNLTAQGMEDAVRLSKNVIILLTKGLMGRPFCQMEQRWAKQYNCNLIGIKEEDERHGAADFGEEIEAAPDDLKFIFNDVEFIPLRRRGYECEGMVQAILNSGTSTEVEDKRWIATAFHDDQTIHYQGECFKDQSFENVSSRRYAVLNTQDQEVVATMAECGRRCHFRNYAQGAFMVVAQKLKLTIRDSCGSNGKTDHMLLDPNIQFAYQRGNPCCCQNPLIQAEPAILSDLHPRMKERDTGNQCGLEIQIGWHTPTLDLLGQTGLTTYKKIELLYFRDNNSRATFQEEVTLSLKKVESENRHRLRAHLKSMPKGVAGGAVVVVVLWILSILSILCLSILWILSNHVEDCGTVDCGDELSKFQQRSLVADQGKDLGASISPMTALDSLDGGLQFHLACAMLCLSTAGCNSFSTCETGPSGCWMKDKLVSAASASGGNNPRSCHTYFKKLTTSDQSPTCKCTNTCSDSNDGDCDDGGPGKDYSRCSLGTDCADCGPSTRTSRSGGTCPATAVPTGPTGLMLSPSPSVLTSPYGGSITSSQPVFNQPAVFTGCGSTSGHTAKFHVRLQPGETLSIHQTQNSFDSRHSMFWSESANPTSYPGGAGSVCVDDPDTQTETLANSGSSARQAWFVVNGYVSGSSGSRPTWTGEPETGSFTVAWTITHTL